MQAEEEEGPLMHTEQVMHTQHSEEFHHDIQRFQK